MDSAEYLGVDIDGQGATDAATLERLCKANAPIEQLKASGIRRPRVSMERLQRIYGALIRPMWTYAVHWAPFLHQLERAAAEFLDKVIGWLYPRLPKHSRKRARRLLAIEDADIRRSMQMWSMVSRMQAAHQEALESGHQAEIVATGEDVQTVAGVAEDDALLEHPREEQIARWQAVEESRNRTRKVAESEGLELHPLWHLPTVRHATCAANWCFGRFPKDREATRLYLGSDYDGLNEALRAAFLKAQWTKEDEATVVHVLERMSDFWPYPLRHRRLQRDLGLPLTGAA